MTIGVPHDMPHSENGSFYHPFSVTAPRCVKIRDRKRICPNVQAIAYMERRYRILLTLAGIAAGLYTAITYQWVLMVIIVAVVALIPVAVDVAGRIRV